jgi:hypothetical protein
MRYLRVLWVLPALLLAQTAEAARISFATENCGTPPLLGLEFSAGSEGITPITTGSTLSCPDALGGYIPGAIADDSGTPLYGSPITSLQFVLTSDGTIPTFDVDEGIAATLTQSAQVGSQATLFVSFTTPGITVPTPCSPTVPSVDTDSTLLCFEDLAIGVFEDFVGTVSDLETPVGFRVTAVNGVPVPEPASLSLLGLGLVVAAVRRRRAIALKSRASSAPDTAHRT